MSLPDSRQEVNELKDIISSRSYRNLLARHKESLQNEVNTFVSEQKWTEAYGALTRLKDAEKIVELASIRLKELEKGS